MMNLKCPAGTAGLIQYSIVHSMDRLARNLVDLCQMVMELTDKGVTLEFVKEHLTFAAGKSDPFATLQMQMLGSLAQFERELLLQRQQRTRNCRRGVKSRQDIPLNARQTPRINS
jgi:DNA invertase Pin-like site-specific DNA recombinase